MSIDRVPSVPFAQIANAALRDKRLSFRARGILAMVLSHSGDWNASRDFIASQSDKEGREAIQTALNELTDLGYRTVVKEKQQDGTFATFTQWSHQPTDGRETDRPETRLTENPSVLRTQSLRTPLQNTKQTLSSDDQRFSEFWDAYPRKAGKQAARMEWFKIISEGTSPDDIIAGAHRYNSDPNREPHYTAMPKAWLKDGRWEDEPLPTRSTKGAKPTRVSKFEELARQFATSDRLEIGQ